MICLESQTLEQISGIQDFFQSMNKQMNRDLKYYLNGYVTVEQYFLLKKISQREKWNPSELAKKICVNKSAISIMINRLVRKGYVRRVRDKEDGRMIYIVLTEDAKIILELGNNAIDEINKSYFWGFSDVECNELMLMMDKFNRACTRI